jgi:NAD(P)-dependent dehydrogenase (short-subunit alcohol dehydrogenase family)
MPQSTKPTITAAEAQHQQPGKEFLMKDKPDFEAKWYKGSGKLKDKVAFITGGDSGIGRAVAVLYAREGAHIALTFFTEEQDARDTAEFVKKENRECLIFQADLRDRDQADRCIGEVFKHFGRLDCVVNNQAVQFEKDSLIDIPDQQLHQTFETNIYGYFYVTRAALPFLKEGATIINTTSVTAYRGSPHLIDYASTKGAIVSFTRSLATNLADKKIRVNAVAPGPVWTPLIAGSFEGKKLEEFGQKAPLGRAAQPEEIAPCYVFLAAQDSSFMTGQVLHPNGGEIING